jgi:hypothetical protein
MHDQRMDGEGFSRRGGMWLVNREDTSWDYFAGTRYSVSWPFAQLHATPEQLTVSAPILGTFAVTHANLASITPFGRVPVIPYGLSFEAYFRRQVAVFWTFRRSTTIAELADLGWHVNDRP